MPKYVFILSALLFLMSGCSKVTKENYDKIKAGMSYKEVVKLIGKADECSETLGISNCKWQSGKSTIAISFFSDQVTFSSAENLK